MGNAWDPGPYPELESQLAAFDRLWLRALGWGAPNSEARRRVTEKPKAHGRLGLESLRGEVITTVSSAVLKDCLADYLLRVERGEQMVVFRDGRPVAALVPMPRAEAIDEESVLALMAAEGLVSLPKSSTGKAFQGTPVVSPGNLASEMVIEDR